MAEGQTASVEAEGQSERLARETRRGGAGGGSRRGLLVALAAAAACSRGEKVEVNDQTIDRGDLMAVIDPVWHSVSIYDGPGRYEADLRRFSTEQRHLLACLWYQAEVRNGGHEQFYFNSTGLVWRDAVAGFRAIGAPGIAEIVEESARRLGGAPSLDRDERQRQLERFAPIFDELDTRFYDLEESLDLDGKMKAYVGAHRSAFYFSGRVKKGR